MESFTNLEKQTTHYTTRTYRLDRMHSLLAYLGHPELSFKKIHLAGSKGKGSTASYLASALTALAIRQASISPPTWWTTASVSASVEHFSTTTCWCRPDRTAGTVDWISFFRPVGRDRSDYLRTLHRLCLSALQNSGCEWAVIETGLGGRLDATNTIVPEACVLCPIELEHTKILGDTIEKLQQRKVKS
jgi:dihydrofolate synthase/folylpolyglutamate synthase